MSTNNSKDILITLIEVYKYSYDLFLKYDAEDIKIPLNNLNYWADRRLLESNLNFGEIKEIIDAAHDFFSMFLEMGIVIHNKKNIELFNLISNRNYVESYNLYKKLITN